MATFHGSRGQTIVPSTSKLTCGLTSNTERPGSTGTPLQHQPVRCAGTTSTNHAPERRMRANFPHPTAERSPPESSHVNVGWRQEVGPCLVTGVGHLPRTSDTSRLCRVSGGGLFMSSPRDEYRQAVPVVRCLPQVS